MRYEMLDVTVAVTDKWVTQLHVKHESYCVVLMTCGPCLQSDLLHVLWARHPKCL